MTKTPGLENVWKEGFILAHGIRMFGPPRQGAMTEGSILHHDSQEAGEGIFISPLLFYLGSQPMEWFCPHSGYIIPSVLSGNTLTDAPRGVSQPSSLTMKINHHTGEECSRQGRRQTQRPFWRQIRTSPSSKRANMITQERVKRKRLERQALETETLGSGLRQCLLSIILFHPGPVLSPSHPTGGPAPSTIP